MGRKSIRILLRVALVAVALFVVLFAAARFLVPADKVARFAATRVAESTGGSVDFGAVSVSLWPRLSLVVDDVTLAGTGEALAARSGAPNPLGDYRVAVASLRADLAWGPLLKRRVGLGKVTLDRPEITVSTRAEQAAPAAAPAGDAGGAAEPAAESLPVSLLVAGLGVQSGSLVWTEVGGARRVSVTGWDQDVTLTEVGALLERLTGLGAGRPAAVGGEASRLDVDTRVASIELTGFGPRPMVLEDVAARGRLEIPPAADRAEIVVDQATWGPLLLAAEAAMTPGGRPGLLDLKGEWRLREVALPELAAAATPLLPPFTEELASWWEARPLRGGDAELAGILDATWPLPEAMTPADLLARLRPAGRVRGLDLDLPGEGPSLAGDIAIATVAAGDRLSLKLTGGAWGPAALTADLTAAPGAGNTFAVAGSWKAEAADLGALAAALAPLMPPLEGEAATWWAAAPVRGGSLSAAGTLRKTLPPPPDALPADLMAGVKGEGEVRDLVVALPRSLPPFTGAAKLRLDGPRAVLDTLLGRVAGGTIAGGGALDFAADPKGAYVLRAAAREVPASVLLGMFASRAAPLVEGRVEAALSGGGRLGDSETVLQSLRLDGDAVLLEGVVHATDMLSGVSRYLGARQDLKEIRYHKLLHHIRVADGRYHLSDLQLQGPDTDWRGDGSVGFAGDLDLDLSVKLPKGFTPDLGDLTGLAESLRGDDGRLRLDMKLTGPAKRPQVTLDLSRAQNKLEDQLKQGVKGFLDKLKGTK